MSGGSLFLLIVLIIIVIGYFYFKRRAKNKALENMYGYVPSHVELYFQEYFDDIIENWDLVDKKTAKEWASDINGRLDNVSSDINELKSNRDEIDRELDGIEKRIGNIEGKLSKKK